MKRHILLLMAAAITGTALVPATHAASTQTAPGQLQPSVQDLLKRVGTQKKDDFVAIRDALSALVAHPDFGTLAPDFQTAIYTYLAATLSYLGDHNKAYEAITSAEAVPNTKLEAKYWELRTSIEIKQGKETEALQNFIRRARQFPQDVNTYKPRHIFELTGLSRKLGNPKLERELLEALKAAEYDPGGGNTAEVLWFQLLQIYLTTGEIEKASAIAGGLKTSYPVIQLKLDKRYQPLRQISAQDIEDSLEYDLEGYRKASNAQPQKFEATFRLATELGEHNRPAAGLAILDTALARIDAAPKNQPAYDDLNDLHNWGLDTRSRLLRQLGRYDDAEAAMIKAHKLGTKYNSDMVSHTINLGWLYNSLSRPKEALKAVNGVESKGASLYGRMSAEEVRACAYAQLGEISQLKASLELMLENAAAAYRPLETALLCANDTERLAQLLIARLDDPLTRGTALMDAQTYLPRMGATAQETLLEDRRRETIARNDVQAAVRKYGEIISLPMNRRGY